MNADGLSRALNDLMTRQTRGLGQHLREAKPYLSAATMPVWAEVRRMIDADLDQARRVSRLMERHRLAVQSGSFAQVVAAYHYMDVPHLLPLLIGEKQGQIEACRRALDCCDPGADNGLADEIQTILAENEAQLEQMEGHRQRVR
ncbi:MAG: hypothetical protein CMJ18_00735 [Phycisphaeraceae bacterium]|nr:hypothetical protein [Phycisphaeraceae bacterium]